jgi:tocopherol O-methyltransferase
MDVRTLTDRQLVEQIEAGTAVRQGVVDEYYQRCIPLYLDFLGVHWHTGFYRDEDASVSSQDQVRMIDYIANSIGLNKADRVLDVGCGIGATLCHLSRRLSCEVVGLTPVPEQKKIAECLADSRNATIQVDLGYAEELPYPDDSFDAVIFFESACHFKDRQAFFKEAYRVLKPGGRLAGEDWLATDLSNESQRVKWIEPICKSWAIPMLGDATEYRRLMEAAKLVDIMTIDMQTIMPLHKGFSVTEKELDELQQEIQQCTNPLLALTLRGMARLGLAVNAGAFTIGHSVARKPPAVHETKSRSIS